MNNQFIVQENISTFPKSEKKPLGEVHRDLGILSYNSNLDNFIYREFHVEGFAIIYELAKEVTDSSQIVFISREIENNPGNWKARLTLEIISESEFLESFDIAMDGETFVPFLSNKWIRVN